MKNRLLFTTALIAAAFAVSDARAERLVVSSGEEEAVNAEMSANDNSELQGGAILNSGKLTVADGVVFNGNAGSVGGAVSTVDASGAAVIGDNVSFIGNTSAMQGGAYHNQRATSTIGDNAKFHNNTAIGYGGGAVYQDTDGREAVLTIGDNAEFKGNKSETSHGGAVMNFNAGDKAEITIGKNAVFSGNSAGKTGGAVANWGGSMRLGEGASFAENRAAADGGAVYNANYGGKNAEMTIAGVSVFENNEATGLGGAVYNDGKLNMGGAVFSGNKAGGKLNDVYSGFAHLTKTLKNNRFVFSGVISGLAPFGTVSRFITHFRPAEPVIGQDQSVFHAVNPRVDRPPHLQNGIVVKAVFLPALSGRHKVYKNLSGIKFLVFAAYDTINVFHVFSCCWL